MTAAAEPIGTRHGVTLLVAVRDAVTAEVDLSCAGVFAHELGAAAPVGGLAHLDAALDHAVTRLRAEGHFTAGEGETLLISRPPPGIAARRVLLVGLGAPEHWSPAVMGRAVALAARTALQLKTGAAAFAPGMLDGGLDPAATAGAAEAMVAGLLRALDAQARLEGLGLSEPSALTRWIFDVGGPRFASATAGFRAALAASPAP